MDVLTSFLLPQAKCRWDLGGTARTVAILRQGPQVSQVGIHLTSEKLLSHVFVDQIVISIKYYTSRCIAKSYHIIMWNICKLSMNYFDSSLRLHVNYRRLIWIQTKNGYHWNIAELLGIMKGINISWSILLSNKPIVVLVLILLQSLSHWSCMLLHIKAKINSSRCSFTVNRCINCL